MDVGGAFFFDRPVFAGGTATFRYRLDGRGFTESLQFPAGFNAEAADTPAFAKMLDLAALVLGVSYYKLRAPLVLDAGGFHLTPAERAFVLDVYENGLGEFYARNGLERFGRIELKSQPERRSPLAMPLAPRTLLPVGGGKDSLVSAVLLDTAGADYTPFAVNPRGPILRSVERIGRPPLFVARTLDPEMIRLGDEPGFRKGHVPSTAINSMVAALAALLFGYGRIAMSNERSASEGNIEWDGRIVNHQYSKSLAFEDRLAGVLSAATDGALEYFSLLRPYSEARIARLFAATTHFDDVFSSCNRNFRYDGHDGPLWCGQCPKCHFVFLILAPEMPKARLTGIFGRNVLADPANEASFRALTGLAGQKPWECVGEILEAAASLFELNGRAEWQRDAIVQGLAADLAAQYGEARLRTALGELMADSSEHRIPVDLAPRSARHAS